MGQVENEAIAAEFHANGGRVGGPFAGMPMALLHTTGARSGQPRMNPMTYLPGDAVGTPELIYVFASNAGRPKHPGWYFNAVAAGTASVEIGTPEGIESYDVSVTDVLGAEHDRVYAEQVRRNPAFADYAERNVGIRTIPVLALRRRSSTGS